eukprot:scaffold57_cov254-Pinguiococcus_pyrenoidosus.AAC.37
MAASLPGSSCTCKTKRSKAKQSKARQSKALKPSATMDRCGVRRAGWDPNLLLHVVSGCDVFPGGRYELEHPAASRRLDGGNARPRAGGHSPQGRHCLRSRTGGQPLVRSRKAANTSPKIQQSTTMSAAANKEGATGVVAKRDTGNRGKRRVRF